MKILIAAAGRRPLTRQAHAVLTLLASGLTGCATIVHGTTQVIPIVSDPPGATVVIDGDSVGKTPVLAKLSRRRAHLVTVSRDSAPPVTVRLDRHVSGWVLGNLFLDMAPVLVDFATGGAFAFDSDTVRVRFPGRLAADEMIRFGVAPADRIRFRTASNPASLVYARVDSVAAGQLHVHSSFVEMNREYYSPAVVPLTDVRQLDFAVGGGDRQNGWTGVHHAHMVSWGVPIIAGIAIAQPALGLAAGGLYSVVAAPVGYLLGSAYPSRWAPREARRAGSPLLVDDRLRVWTVGSERRLSGQLVTVDSSVLHIAVGGDTVRIQRASIAAVQLHDGYDFARGAKRGLVVGALIGAFAGAEARGSVFNPNGADLMIGSGAGAVLGLLGTAALAPRRWVDVRKW